jgi:hypothetical protein
MPEGCGLEIVARCGPGGTEPAPDRRRPSTRVEAFVTSVEQVAAAPPRAGLAAAAWEFWGAKIARVPSSCMQAGIRA